MTLTTRFDTDTESQQRFPTGLLIAGREVAASGAGDMTGNGAAWTAAIASGAGAMRRKRRSA